MCITAAAVDSPWYKCLHCRTVPEAVEQICLADLFIFCQHTIFHATLCVFPPHIYNLTFILVMVQTCTYNICTYMYMYMIKQYCTAVYTTVLPGVANTKSRRGFLL